MKFQSSTFVFEGGSPGSGSVHMRRPFNKGETEKVEKCRYVSQASLTHVTGNLWCLRWMPTMEIPGIAVSPRNPN